MFRRSGNNIKVLRTNTFEFDIDIQEVVADPFQYTAVMSIRLPVIQGTEAVIFRKNLDIFDNKVEVRFEKADWTMIPIGDLTWDITLTSLSEVVTLFANADFIVEGAASVVEPHWSMIVAQLRKHSWCSVSFDSVSQVLTAKNIDGETVAEVSLAVQ